MSAISMSTISASFSGTVLTVGNGFVRQIQMEAPIISALVDTSGQHVLVLVETPVGAALEPNLFCIDAATGAAVWSRAADTSRSRENIFTSMRLDAGGSLLIVFDWDGYRSKLDIATGKVFESEFLK